MSTKQSNLETLIDDLRERRAVSKDYIASPESMLMDGGLLVLKKEKHKVFYVPTKIAHGQMASKLNIPQAYYDRMLQAHVDLLDKSVNTWLGDQDENYFLRTFERGKNENTFRALLSDNYKVMDNYDVLNAFFEALYSTQTKADIMTATVTEQRLYIKVVAQNIQADASPLLLNYKNPQTGQRSPVAKIGIEMTNSEVGKGAFQLMPFMQFDCCMNRLKISDSRLRKIHLGAQMEGGEDWSNATNELNSKLIISQVQDSVGKFLTERFLRGAIAKLEDEAGIKLKHPVDAINNVTRLGGYSEERREAVLNYFVQGGDTSAFGVVQALTFEAHEQLNEDDIYEAENFAASVVGTSKTYDKPFSAN